jgi:hypothetical protein
MIAFRVTPRCSCFGYYALLCTLLLVLDTKHACGAQTERFGSVPVVGQEIVVFATSPGEDPKYARMTQGAGREYFGNICGITLTNDGQLTTQKMIDGQYREVWSSGKSLLMDEAGGHFVAKLRSDGVLEKTFEPSNDSDAIVFYETVHQVDHDYAMEEFFPETYVLTIDEDCVLRIYGFARSDGSDDDTYDDDDDSFSSSNLPHEVWSNVRQAMTEGDVMLQGDIIRGGHNGQPTYMKLQHDCNLVQKYGSDETGSGSLIWASGSDRSSDPDDVKCWVLVDNAKVQVCVGEFDATNRKNCNAPGTEIRYSTRKSEWDIVELGSRGFKESSSTR